MSHFFAIFVHEAPAVIGKLMTKQKEDPQHYNYQLAEDAETRVCLHDKISPRLDWCPTSFSVCTRRHDGRGMRNGTGSNAEHCVQVW